MTCECAVCGKMANCTYAIMCGAEVLACDECRLQPKEK